MGDESADSSAKYVVGIVLMCGILSAMLILQGHNIAGGAAALAAVIYVGRFRVK